MLTAAERRRLALGACNPLERVWFDKYSLERLQAWRQVCDEPADACARQLRFQRPAAMLAEVERRAAAEGGVFQDFLAHAHTVPGWVDFDMMESGRRVMGRYGLLQGLILLCSSLTAGYAFNKPNQVLLATGRLQKDVSKRIFETGQFLHNMTGPEGLRPGGVGHRTILEVRLLHAAVRHHLLSTGHHDTEHYQQPINQEDMAGTILAFDFVVARGLRQFGVMLSEAERAATHYFWRYAGWLLGVDEALLPASPAEQDVLAAQLFTHLYAPDERGAELARALLRDMANQPPYHLSERVLHGISRSLIGDELADAFGLTSGMSTEAALAVARAAIRLADAGMHLLPDFGLRRLEHFNFQLGREALLQGLGREAGRWGFEHMA